MLSIATLICTHTYTHVHTHTLTHPCARTHTHSNAHIHTCTLRESTHATLTSDCCACLHIALLPCLQYIAVSRSAFCYHYMPGLLYGELLLAIMLDALAESVATRFKFSLHVAVIVASALGLAYWAPWVYAIELSKQGVCAGFWGRSSRIC